MLDFVLELKEKYNFKKVKFEEKSENKKIEREKRKFQIQKGLQIKNFNDNINMKAESQIKKKFREDQENFNQKIIFNKDSKKSLINKNKTMYDFFKQKVPENKLNLHFSNNHKCYEYNNLSNKSLLKDLKFNTENFEKNYVISSRGKYVDFFDEKNKKNIRFPSYEEKDFKFCKSKIIPQVKLMKLDNDVQTEDEQIKDATSMLKENMKEIIKSLNIEGKEYLQKNLSRKINFKKK